MIEVTRIDGGQIVVNALLIQQIEASTDTIITLTSGRKLMVQETPEQVVERAVAYLHRLHSTEGKEGIAAGQWGRVVQ